MPSKFGSKCARSPEDIWISTKLREGNVFSYVCLLEGVPYGYYPWCIRPHWTGSPALSRHGTSLYRDPSKYGTSLQGSSSPSPPGHGALLYTDKGEASPTLLVTSCGHHWRLVQTCSLQDPSCPLVLKSDGYWSRYGQLKRVAFILLSGQGKVREFRRDWKSQGKITQNTWKWNFRHMLFLIFSDI